MKVKDLITKLSKFGENEEIAFYTSEEGNAYKVNEHTQVDIYRDKDWDGDRKKKIIFWVG